MTTMTPEEITADRHARDKAEDDAALAVERVLTESERAAIIEYAGPRLKGAAVADILSIACDHDANLGLTEPFHEDHGDAIREALGSDGGAYESYLRSWCTAFAAQAAAILTRKVPQLDHVRSLASDALKVATGEVEAPESKPDAELLAKMEARRTPHPFEGTDTQCARCDLADGAVVHRQAGP